MLVKVSIDCCEAMSKCYFYQITPFMLGRHASMIVKHNAPNEENNSSMHKETFQPNMAKWHKMGTHAINRNFSVLEQKCKVNSIYKSLWSLCQSICEDKMFYFIAFINNIQHNGHCSIY